MVRVWPRAARATRHAAVDAVGVGELEVVAHGVPEAGLVQREFRLARQAAQVVWCKLLVNRKNSAALSGLSGWSTSMLATAAQSRAPA